MRWWPFRTVGTRLGLAFVGVTLAAEGVFGIVTVLSEGSDVARLASTQRSATTAAVVSALESSYRATGAWSKVDWRPAVVLAERSDAYLVVTAPGGRVLARGGASPPAAGAGQVVLARRPVRADGRVVAEVRLQFASGGLSPADRSLRASLARSVALSAVLATLGALTVALVATRALTKPVRRLSAVVEALGAGAWGARVVEPKGSTELAELERALNAMAASLERHEQLRQAMVADLAHELRTPVAVLQAETEALVDGVSAPTPEALVSLHDEALRLGRMVEDLQTLASAEAASLNLQWSMPDLAGIVADAASSMDSQFAASGVGLVLHLSAAVVKGDPGRLRQVATNLLSNAAKFTPPGGKVEVTVRPQPPYAYLEVADSGPGVPPAERERVFERFYRGRAGQSVGGSGIGLAVVKDLVEAHGGEVSVDRSALGGACFEVRLPLAPQPPRQ